MSRVAVIVCAGLILPLAAFAQDKGVPAGFDQKKMFEQMQQQMMAQFDVDKDGKLNAQENMMAQEAMRRQGINVGMAPGGFPGADQFAKQFDRDGDGKLNQQEAMMAQAAYQRMRSHGSGMRGGLNGNGGGGGGSGMQPQQPIAPPNGGDGKGSKASPLIKRFDKDGDGKLNTEEKAAAQAELKKDKSKEKDAKPKDAKAK
jgi:Ca2+-binding EF-hand superfamily protein